MSCADPDVPTATSANLVSVIIPCYNGAAFLSTAIHSALRQTHTAVEVIVVDDGSTDTSPAIAHAQPVRYIRQENRGLSEARNTGIRASRGAYLVFLDSDDLLLPEAVASGLRALAANPDCVMAVGDHAFISAEGFHIRNSGKNLDVTQPYQALLRSNFIEMISSVLFRRGIFDHVGLFSANLRVAEDYDLYLRIARQRSLCCHAAMVAQYRLHGSNMSRNSELMLITTLQVLRSQKQYIRNNGGMQNAFRWGVRNWSRQYGRKLVTELTTPGVRVDHTARKFRTLAAWYPQGILFYLLIRLHPRPLRHFFPGRRFKLPIPPTPSST